MSCPKINELKAYQSCIQSFGLTMYILVNTLSTRDHPSNPPT